MHICMHMDYGIHVWSTGLQWKYIVKQITFYKIFESIC